CRARSRALEKRRRAIDRSRATGYRTRARLASRALARKRQSCGAQRRISRGVCEEKEANAWHRFPSALVLRQAVAQIRERAHDVLLDRTARHSEAIGDFRVAVALELMEYQHVAALLRERFDCLDESRNVTATLMRVFVWLDGDCIDGDTRVNGSCARAL